MRHDTLAEALFAAFTSGDDEAVRALCSADLTAQQNGNPPFSLETLLKFAAAFRSVVTGYEYADARRAATPTGFVEEHAVRGTLPDGSQLDLAACVVGDVRHGKIVALREYFDPEAAVAVTRALSQ